MSATAEQPRGARRLAIVLANLVFFWGALPAGLYLLGRALDRGLGLGLDARWRWPGLALAAFGLYICVHAIALLRYRGQGLPISALPPRRLVRSGPYRFVRHPIYLGAALLFVGLGLALRSPSTALLVIPAFTALWLATWVALYEEPRMHRLFGADFRAYRSRTPLFFPRLLRWLLWKAVLCCLRRLFRIRVVGRERVPRRGPLCIVTDHASYTDSLFGQLVSPRPIAGPVSAEAFRTPLARALMRLIGGVPTRRFCPDPAALLALADVIREGGVIGVAVEGERSWTGELALPTPSAAANLLGLACPLLPVSFNGSYRLWPRWAGAADRSQQVTIRIGEPFDLAAEVRDVPAAERPAAAARAIRERIAALRDPDEASVDLRRFRGARPELALFRCPLCRAEETLALDSSAQLACSACGARWSTAPRDLTLVAPAERAGERDTLAGWASRAGRELELAEGDGALLRAENVELREDADGRLTLAPLHALGSGTAELFRDRLAWRGADVERTVPLAAVSSVTTERNNTLQLGVGRGVLQLVFAAASPLRWQLYTAHLVRALRGSARR